MPQSIYLINPSDGVPTYNGVEVFTAVGLQPVSFCADLTTATVAAFVPEDFTVRLCDESISLADLDDPSSFIGITGKTNQVNRMIELAGLFRQQGKVVLIGGPFATLCPEVVRPHCDILVRGEFEEVAPQLFGDLRRGNWQAEYVGARPALNHSPIPRWDLYPNHRALNGCVQTSRGCPFECEFCDVIVYVGRRQRFKPVDRVLAELDVLYDLGYRNIFLADDNLTAHRGHAIELLSAIRDWNRSRTRGEVGFNTQLSMDMADEDELLILCDKAGISLVLLGLETPNTESLREVKKSPNIGRAPEVQVRKFYEHGISVETHGMIGFDADGPDIFEQHYQLAMQVPIPVYSPVAVFATFGTPFYERLKRSGRLSSQDLDNAYTPWSTNFNPRQMSHSELFGGLRWLANNLYHPEAFGERVLKFIDLLRNQSNPLPPKGVARQVDMDATKIVRQISRLGQEEATMLTRVMKAAAVKPAAQRHLIRMLLHFMQVRHLYRQGGIWAPELAGTPPPIK